MRIHRKESIIYYSYEIFEPYQNFEAVTFGRQGGVSQGPFSSLNLSLSANEELNKGETKDNVRKNFEIVKTVLPPELKIFNSLQVHGDIVEVITPQSDDQLVCDGLVTQFPNLGLIIKHADCQVGIFFDPKNIALGVIHSGWKGMVKNIYSKTVETMKKAFGTQPEDLIVAISPSLGPCHAEFKHYQSEFPQNFWPYQVRPNYFNLWEIAKMQLIRAGIKENKIQISGMCTYANDENFFSYRREKISGRNGTLAFLKH